MSQRAADLDGFFGTSYAKVNGHEVWHLEYKKSTRQVPR
jgi:hypothetical protein